MKDKKLLSLAALLVGVIAIGLIFYLIAGSATKVETPTQDEIAQQQVSGEVVVYSNLINNSLEYQITIDLSPLNENPVLLSAIGLRGYVSGADFSQEDGLTVLPNTMLSDNNWQFRITNAEPQEDGTILIEIAANHRGDELYPLDTRVNLAAIQLSGEYQEKPLTFEVDSESTVFAGEDVEVLYPYQSK